MSSSLRSRTPLAAAFWAVLAPCLFLCASARAADDADGAYKTLLETWKSGKHAEALALAEAFVRAHPDFKYASGALYMGGNAGLKAGEPARAEPLYRALLKRFPTYKKARAARDELVSALSSSRRLEACIAQCEENLRADPDAPQRDRWAFYRGESLFRLWRFDEAKEALEAFLSAHPDSSLAGRARESLGRIEPGFETDGFGVVKGYAGKYLGDGRLQRARESLPALVEKGYGALQERLGLDLRGRAAVLFQFEDAGDKGRGGTRGNSFAVCRKGAPATVILFYTEYVVLSPEDFEGRVVHELKHAGFRGLMGQRYLELPRWVREGLAVWGAGQTEGRVLSILSNEVFSGKDPMALLNGIVTGRSFSDYMEDALAVAWLEEGRPGAVARFCRLLSEGAGAEEAFAEAAGLPWDEAIAQADAACRGRVASLLGEGWPAYRALREDGFDAQRAGPEALASWLEAEGIERFASWLEAHPDHPLAPNARYRLGKACVLAGRHEEGRRWLQRVLEGDFLRSTVCDDAALWIATSFEREGKDGQARDAFGILLRDYSWSKAAAKARDRFDAAGPGDEGEEEEEGD